MLILGEVRYERGTLVVEPPLELPEGTRLLLVRIDGILALVPAEDDAFANAVEASIREHYETLKALVQ